jgi:hypothetical protein
VAEDFKALLAEARGKRASNGTVPIAEFRALWERALTLVGDAQSDRLEALLAYAPAEFIEAEDESA